MNASDMAIGKSTPSRSLIDFPLSMGLLSFSFLLWEMLLARLYSVLLYYYFSFVVISLAMLGLAIGAAWVSLRDGSDTNIAPRLSHQAFWTSLGMNIAVFLIVALSSWLPSLPFWAKMLFLFSISAFPCITAGSFICLALTRTQQINVLYSANMLGSGLACLLMGFFLQLFGAPAAVSVSAVPAAVASIILSRGSWRRGALALGISLMTGLLFVINPHDHLRLQSGAGYPRTIPLLEKWNSFSRVAVFKFPLSFNWGISPLIEASLPPIDQRQLEVDCGSMTPLTRFDGNLESISYLKHDITGFAHHLRPNTKVLIIGSGGGRDILASLVFKQPQIKAVEINPLINDAVNNYFGDFTGHLDQIPQVQFVNAEGRNFLERSSDSFGIIQLSLIDTWSANAAGAYSFIENGLYTVEAWRTLLSHLKPDGILSVTRWYYGSENWPVHIIRGCVLGMTALQEKGVAAPEKCVVVLRLPKLNPHQSSVGTVLLAPAGFSDHDLDTLEKQCQQSGCEIAYSWRSSLDSNLTLMMQPGNLRDFIASAPMDISPPTDDRPYFQFHDYMFRSGQDHNVSKIITPSGVMLKNLLIVVGILVLSIVGLVIFVLNKKQDVVPSAIAPFGTYFTMIALAYMFVELGLIQRFSLFLGHPLYGFTVILFGFLLSNSWGSYLSQKITAHFSWFLFMAFLLGLYLTLGHFVIGKFSDTSILFRTGLTFVLVIPLGVLMGFFLPWGLRSVAQNNRSLTGLCWTMNSAMSILAAVLGKIFLIGLGESRTIIISAVLYLLSGFLFKYRFRNMTAGQGNQ